MTRHAMRCSPCDEVVSALDASVRTSILQESWRERTTTCVLIAHELLVVVRRLAQRAGAQYLWYMMDLGESAEVFPPPSQSRTEMPFALVLGPSPNYRLPAMGKIDSVGILHYSHKGCRLAPSCPRRVGEICDTQVPHWGRVGDRPRIRWHVPVAELRRAQREIA